MQKIPVLQYILAQNDIAIPVHFNFFRVQVLAQSIYRIESSPYQGVEGESLTHNNYYVTHVLRSRTTQSHRTHDRAL